jgi:putative spermidine/putrescine transport system permease protein
MRPRTAILLAALVLLPVGIGYLVFFGAPLGLLGLESVQHRHSGYAVGYPGGGASSYARVLTSPLYRRLLGETFKLAGLCALLCLLVGYPLAWGLRLASDRVRRVVVLGVMAPVLIGVVVRSLGWLVVLGEFSLVNLVLRTLRLEADLSRRSHLLSEMAVLGGMVQVFFPFMVLALFGAVGKIDLGLIRAARNLGATRMRAFFAVVVPLSLPGAAIGVATVFALATGAYVTVAVVGGVRVRSMAEMAYEESSTLVNWQLGAAVVVAVAVAAGVLVRLLLGGIRRADRLAEGAGRGAIWSRISTARSR